MRTSSEVIKKAKWNLDQYDQHKHASYLVTARDLLTEALFLKREEDSK